MKTKTWLLSTLTILSLIISLFVWQPDWGLPIPMAALICAAIFLAAERIATWAVPDHKNLR